MQIFCTQTEQDTEQATKRSLAIDVCICLNHQERQSLASLFAGSRRWNYEVLFLHAQAWHTRSDDVSDLSICRPISDFWNSLPLESIRGLVKGFCMWIFKFSEWDLEQTTTKSTIIIYSSLDSSCATIYRANTTSDSFVLIIVSHSALISCVNTIHKTCHRVVKICNRGGNKIYWSSGEAVTCGFAARVRDFAALCVRV